MTAQAAPLGSSAKANPREEPSSRPSRRAWERNKCLLLGVDLTALQTINTSKVRMIPTLTADMTSKGTISKSLEDDKVLPVTMLMPEYIWVTMLSITSA